MRFRGLVRFRRTVRSTGWCYYLHSIDLHF